jgi:hypothetical protein
MGPVYRYLVRPPLTAEISCMPGFEGKPPIFPVLRAMQNSALLKYFLLTEGLRRHVRFLTDSDFEIASVSGQLIRPQPVVLLVWQADISAITRLVADSPLPLTALYQMNGDHVTEHLFDAKGEWSTNKLYPKTSGLRDQLSCGLNAAARSGQEKIPVLIVPSIDQYLACADWCYLNALLKYIAWRELGYVGLENQGHGRLHSEFPELQFVQGDGVLSFRLAAGTVHGIQEHLHIADAELKEIVGSTNSVALEFPALVNEARLF